MQQMYMVSNCLIKKINFGENENYTFFVSGDIRLSVNQGTDFWRKRYIHPQSILYFVLHNRFTKS
jgi:hypothetical protein